MNENENKTIEKQNSINEKQNTINGKQNSENNGSEFKTIRGENKTSETNSQKENTEQTASEKSYHEKSFSERIKDAEKLADEKKAQQFTSHKGKTQKVLQRDFNVETGKAFYTKVEVPITQTQKSFTKKAIQRAAGAAIRKLENEVTRSENEDVALKAAHQTSKQIFEITKGAVLLHKDNKNITEYNKDISKYIETQKAEHTVAKLKTEEHLSKPITVSRADEAVNAAVTSSFSQGIAKRQEQKRLQKTFYNERNGIPKKPQKPVFNEDMTEKEKYTMTKIYKADLNEYNAKRQLQALSKKKLMRKKTFLEVGAVGLYHKGKNFALSKLESSDNSAGEAAAKSISFVSDTRHKIQKFLKNEKIAHKNKLLNTQTKAGADKQFLENQKKAAQKKMQKKQNYKIFRKKSAKKETAKKIGKEIASKASLLLKGLGSKVILIGLGLILLLILITSSCSMMGVAAPAIILDTYFGWFVGDGGDTPEDVANKFNEACYYVDEIINREVVPYYQQKQQNKVDSSECDAAFTVDFSPQEHYEFSAEILYILAAQRAASNVNTDEDGADVKFPQNRIVSLAKTFLSIHSHFVTPYYMDDNCCSRQEEYIFVDRYGERHLLTRTVYYCDGHHIAEYVSIIMDPDATSQIELWLNEEELQYYNEIKANTEEYLALI